MHVLILSHSPPSQSIGEKDASVFVNPEQPLIANTKVSQEDIDRQEAKVMAIRKRLAEALASLEK